MGIISSTCNEWTGYLPWGTYDACPQNPLGSQLARGVSIKFDLASPYPEQTKYCFESGRFTFGGILFNRVGKDGYEHGEKGHIGG